MSSSSSSKRKRPTAATAAASSRSTKNRAASHPVGVPTETVDLEDAEWSPLDLKMREECNTARYALALWASVCFSPEKERMRSEECFLRDSMRERLQQAIEVSLEEQRNKKRQQRRRQSSETIGGGNGDCEDEDEDKEDEEDGYHLDTEFHAGVIERALFWRWYYLQPAMYRQRCRQIEFNLAQNGWYLLTRFGPLTLCSFTTRKLAEGTSVDEWRTEYRKRTLRDLKPPTPKIEEKGFFQCAKCKSWRTTYYPLQTRGADEPMTNFVTCHNCGNHFRRS